jgi:eukaryotic-like serine/threonine-protein kinase
VNSPVFNILVVDDDELVTKALSTLLRRPDRRVLTCTDPAEVPAIMASQTVDLVISDEEMPKMTGVRLLSMLKKTHPDAVRILLTGRGNVHTAVQAINDCGVFKFLTKPWNQQELNDVVTSALQRAAAQRKPAKPPVADRRRAMLEELEREHPGLLDVGPGTHELILDPIADAIDKLAAGVVARSPIEDLRKRVEPQAAQTSPIALANAFGAIMLRQRCASLVIEPREHVHVISMEVGVATNLLMTLPRWLGDTVVARFAILGGLDIGGMGEQVGRSSFRLGNDKVEFLVTFRTNSLGLAIELRRVVAEIEAEVEAPPSGAGDFIGRYRTLGVIGHGGLGIVYRAIHEALERPVAVKVLHASGAHDEMATARFLREARAASRARHPGIVEVLDFGQTSDGRSFLVMELVESPTLEHRLADGAFPLEQAVAVARSISTALGAAHDAGVVHRDLKPSNVFVDDDGSVKLSDFGAAKIVGQVGPELTQEGTTVGTPHYMSPEHARGLPVDRRTDLYALGCVIYEMVAGKPPFEGQTALDVLSQHISAPPPVPVSPHGPVPHALARVIRRAMAKNPGERHQTAAEMIADLQQAAASLGRTGWRRWLP